MPQDPRINKINDSNGSSREHRETGVTLEELDHLIRRWVEIALLNIEPPSGIWDRIKQRAQQQSHLGQSFSS